MKMQRVFVSGGAGVIGLEMIPRLVARGTSVLIGDLKPRPPGYGASVHYRQGDLNSLSRGELEAFAPDTFIHLAATFERSTESYAFWEENFWHNVRLSHHLMTLAKDLPSLQRVVFASSYLIYDPALSQFAAPRAQAVSLKESDPILPRNLTGMAKLAHEIELRFLEGFRGTAFTSVCARIFRGYGCNSRDVISRWIRALLAGEAIQVFRPEGIFDYVYAADSAEGLIRLAQSQVAGIINLGAGRGRRVQEVVDILRSHFPDMRAEEVASEIAFEASQADISAYRAAVGWSPEYDLERAIPEIIAFEKVRVAGAEKPHAVLGNVLITSASKKVGMVRALQRALRKLHPVGKVFAGDLDDRALSREIADEFWNMPRLESERFADLVEACRERGIRMVVPSRDGELMFWAENRELLAEQGIQVIVSGLETVRVCLDKLAFAKFGAERGLPFISASESVDALSGAASYVVKERFGAGSRKVGINLDRDAVIEQGQKLEHPIYQPYVAGMEISIDAWADRLHNIKGLVLRRRDRVVDGESQVTTTFRDAGLEEQALRVLQSLRVRGPVVIQAIVADGGLQMIECNTRFGGASTISINAGLDSFYWSLLEATGGDVSQVPFVRIPGEVRQVRVPEDVYVYGAKF
jgi:carbamoyl-phosphate synthase large subunit